MTSVRYANHPIFCTLWVNKSVMVMSFVLSPPPIDKRLLASGNKVRSTWNRSNRSWLSLAKSQATDGMTVRGRVIGGCAPRTMHLLPISVRAF